VRPAVPHYDTAARVDRHVQIYSALVVYAEAVEASALVVARAPHFFILKALTALVYSFFHV